MTIPPALRGHTLDDVPLGGQLGRSWVLLFGVIPFDFDDLMLAERDTGRRFLETSSMLTMVTWNHERLIAPVNHGSEVSDRIEFEPRGLARRSPRIRRFIRVVVTAVFRHRHRRLSRYFSK
jgi:ligand-binding SRPBCC domain-containing protein